MIAPTPLIFRERDATARLNAEVVTNRSLERISRREARRDVRSREGWREDMTGFRIFPPPSKLFTIRGDDLRVVSKRGAAISLSQVRARRGRVN